jgi:hypothetical protein
MRRGDRVPVQCVETYDDFARSSRLWVPTGRYAFRLAWRFHGPVHRSQARRFGGIPDTSRGAAKVSQKSPWVDHKVSFRCGDRSARWLSSSGTCWPILRSAFTTSGPTSTTTASAGNARNLTTSANSKHWTTRSPSSLPPDHGFPVPARQHTKAEPVVPLARPRLDFRIISRIETQA